jgi:hypothetical protein
MSYEETYRGTPIDQLNPAEAEWAWHDDLTLDQELALADHDPYSLDDPLLDY